MMRMVYQFLITDNQEYGRIICKQIHAYFREQRLQVCDLQSFQQSSRTSGEVLFQERPEDLLHRQPGSTWECGDCESQWFQTKNLRQVTNLFLNYLMEEEDENLLCILYV
jgi:hypothetical protein